MSTLESRRPRYQVVTDTLLREIEAGHYPVGSFLPVEADLLARFQVSRTTVREALKRLSTLGLVATLHGIGTRVESRRVHTSYVVSMKSIADGVQYEGGPGEFVIVQRAAVPPGSVELESLKLGGDQRWYKVSGYRLSSGSTGEVSSAADQNAIFSDVIMYFREPYHGIVGGKSRHKASFYAAIEKKYGLEIARIEQEIEAVPIASAAARTLGLKPGSPALQVVRRYYCQESEPFEVTVNIYPPKRFTYKMHLQRERG